MGCMSIWAALSSNCPTCNLHKGCHLCQTVVGRILDIHLRCCLISQCGSCSKRASFPLCSECTVTWIDCVGTGNSQVSSSSNGMFFHATVASHCHCFWCRINNWNTNWFEQQRNKIDTKYSKQWLQSLPLGKLSWFSPTRTPCFISEHYHWTLNQTEWGWYICYIIGRYSPSKDVCCYHFNLILIAWRVYEHSK